MDIKILQFIVIFILPILFLSLPLHADQLYVISSPNDDDAPDKDAKILVYNAQNMTLLQSVKISNETMLNDIVVSSNNQYLYVAGDKGLHVLDLANKFNEVRGSPFGKGFTTSVAIHSKRPDEIYVAREDKFIDVYNAKTFNLTKTISLNFPDKSSPRNIRIAFGASPDKIYATFGNGSGSNSNLALSVINLARSSNAVSHYETDEPLLGSGHAIENGQYVYFADLTGLTVFNNSDGSFLLIPILDEQKNPDLKAIVTMDKMIYGCGNSGVLYAIKKKENYPIGKGVSRCTDAKLSLDGKEVYWLGETLADPTNPDAPTRAYAMAVGKDLKKDPVCGNKITEGKEECDDGNKIETDSCLTNCTFNKCYKKKDGTVCKNNGV